jgi:hypothetical protein
MDLKDRLSAGDLWRWVRSSGLGWYLQLFGGIFVSNILVFGHLDDLDSYHATGIYRFNAEPIRLFRSAIRLIHEQDATANDIINTYMNGRDAVGAAFVCDDIRCRFFASQDNKYSFIEETLRVVVIQPLWECLHPADKPTSDGGFLTFGATVPACYRNGLEIVAALSVESQTAVAAANVALEEFSRRLAEVKVELEWPFTERRAKKVFAEHRVLLDAFTKLHISCRENASGVDFCRELPLSVDELGRMQEKLNVVTEIHRTRVEETRKTFLDFVIWALFSAFVGVLITLLIRVSVKFVGHIVHSTAPPDGQGGLTV